MKIPSGSTDRKIYFVGLDATDLVTRETGLSSFTVVRSRDGGGTPVEFAAYVDGKEVGRRLFNDDQGFSEFEFPIEEVADGPVEVTFEVQTRVAQNRDFCFEAEMR